MLQNGILDNTRMFHKRIQSFRKNILLASSSPMKIKYYQDRTEFQVICFSNINITKK